MVGLQDRLFEKDLIRDRRRRLRPLGWLLIFVFLLFLLAMCSALMRWVTHNVSQLPDSPTSLARIHADEAVLPVPSPTAPLCASTPITWTVTAVQNGSGEVSYEAPPAIQKWVIADYLSARTRAEQNKFDLQALRAHLSDYFADDALTQASAELDDLAQTHIFISAGTLQLLPQGRQVAFDASGSRAVITSYLGASTNVQFDVQARQPVGNGDHLPDRMLVEEVIHDTCAGRWKIARSRVVVDLTTDIVMWGQR